MRITITKTWQTEAVINVPDDKIADLDYLATESDKVGNDLLNAEWGNTHITNTDTGEEIKDW